MHDLASQTALGGATPLREDIGGLRITEVFDLALASVTARLGQEAACAQALASVIGAEAPPVGQAKLEPPVAAFWSGPDQWMVSAPFETHETLSATLKTRLGDTASVTEQTDGWVCLDLRGVRVTDLLERLCPVPARRMKAGDTQRTTIDHLGCYVICLETGAAMRILGPRSSAGSLHHAMTTAARSIA